MRKGFNLGYLGEVTKGIIKTFHFTPQFWNNRGVKCSSHQFDPQLLHFYYFQNWMARSPLPLGYLRNRGNKLALLPHFKIITDGKTLIFIIYLFIIFYILVLTCITKSYSGHFWNRNIITEPYFGHFRNMYFVHFPISQT